MLRFIEVIKSPHGSATARETVEALLPDNYEIRYELDDRYVIVGEDVLGWTAKGYVIPRLSSGMIAARLVDDAIREERDLADRERVPVPTDDED